MEQDVISRIVAQALLLCMAWSIIGLFKPNAVLFFAHPSQKRSRPLAFMLPFLYGLCIFILALCANGKADRLPVGALLIIGGLFVVCLGGLAMVISLLRREKPSGKSAQHAQERTLHQVTPDKLGFSDRLEARVKKAEAVTSRIAELGGSKLLFVGKEVKALPEVLRRDELLLAIASGLLDNHKHLLAITDSRLLLLLGNTLSEISLYAVDSIYIIKSGMLGTELEINAGGQIKKLVIADKQLAKNVAQAYYRWRENAMRQTFESAAILKAQRDSLLQGNSFTTRQITPSPIIPPSKQTKKHFD